ncbi:hypothetical protein OEZ72_26230, partial [Leclercia adecarboxylata]
MAENEKRHAGWHAEIAVGGLAVAVITLPLALYNVRSLRVGASLQIICECPLAAHPRFDPAIDLAEQEVARRREEHDQRQHIADEAGK